MSEPYSRLGFVRSSSIHQDEALGFGEPPRRAALIAPPGLFRDSFASLMATCIAEIRLECHDSVEDVAPGAVCLFLLAHDESVLSRNALGAKIETLRLRCGAAPIGVIIPDERAPGLGKLGVAGVVSFAAGAEVAVAAVRLMAIGGYCLPPETLAATRPIDLPAAQEAAPNSAIANPGLEVDRGTRRYDLTAREGEVLRSLRAGHQNKIIAFELGISQSTVKVHLRNIMKKLNASNRTQAALGARPRFAGEGAR